MAGLDLGHPPLSLSFSAAGGPAGLDFDGAGLAGGVVVEAAPTVVFRFGDEASGDWVAVDVLNLFYEFGCGENVEVIVARLPEVIAPAFEELGGFSLENSEGGGEWVFLGSLRSRWMCSGIRT